MIITFRRLGSIQVKNAEYTKMVRGSQQRNHRALVQVVWGRSENQVNSEHLPEQLSWVYPVTTCDNQNKSNKVVTLGYKGCN